ncbi:SRPBCC family protein [Streptomyces sp. NPDC020996]|uniref:SRPBCC family protein n=1 Tax=Streptomyces sp. NPDC020996 TaxID=3154791 RepID=UPI00340C092D
MTRPAAPTPRPRRKTAALTLAVAGAVLLASTATATATAAPAAPGRAAAGSGPAAQCRGLGVDPAARVRYRSDIVIDAPLSTVWKLQTDVERWPSWQPPVLTSERLDPGRLRTGSRFRWTTPAPGTTLDITSTVRALEPRSCVLWTGPATGDGLRIDEGVHLWTFTEVDGHVHVHTEETWAGAQIESDAPTATAALGASLEAWLHALKTTAETRPTAPSGHSAI